MPVDQERSYLVFQKLDRQLSKLAAKPAPESVHRFRTSGRRVEALLVELAVDSTRNDRKLLKLLACMRKKAGRMRDLDVQIASLRNLKIPESAGHKSQLMRTLVEERVRREKKLMAALDKQAVRELRKRLKRAASYFEMPATEPLALAVRLLAKLARDNAPLTEKTLHRYRIAGKRARYLAELDGKDREARRLVDQLKRMQDLIGDWHDWLKLTNRAENFFSGTQGSPLLAVLRNVTRAKFRQAVDALTEIRAEFSEKRPVSVESRRPPTQAAQATAAVA